MIGPVDHFEKGHPVLGLFATPGSETTGCGRERPEMRAVEAPGDRTGEWGVGSQDQVVSGNF
jgi:hypothetical protein